MPRIDGASKTIALCDPTQVREHEATNVSVVSMEYNYRCMTSVSSCSTDQNSGPTFRPNWVILELRSGLNFVNGVIYDQGYKPSV
jgi:hypothetical protein